MTAISFDDLIPPSPAGGAALTPADHAAFALQQRAMAQAAAAPAVKMTPVDHDPFAAASPAAAAPTLTPVDHDPFAGAAQPARPTALSFDDLIPAQPAASAHFAAGDDDPMTRDPASWADTGAAVGKSARYADDIVRLLANGMTFGLADKAAGATISSPEQEAARTAGAKERTGGAGQVAGFAGAMAPAFLGAGLVGAAARGVEAVPMLGRLAANPLVQGATTGAGLGATDAGVNGRSVAGGAALGAAGGAGGAALGGVVGAGARSLGSLFADAPAVPTSAALRGAASQAYDDASNAGVVYSPEAMQRLGDTIRDRMAQFGYAPELQPGGQAVLRSLDRSDGMPTTLQGLDVTRRIAGNMASRDNPSSGALGGQIKGAIDDFAANPRPGEVMMGDPGGVDALARARSLYQSVSKDEGLSEALSRAHDNTGKAGSGGNINNATRQQVATLQNSRQDWTPDEQAALTNIIRGTPLSNTLRLIGKASPEGNGLIAHMSALDGLLGYGIGGTSGALAGAAVPVAGYFAKQAADAGTARAVGSLGQLFRSGGNAAGLQPAPNALMRAGAALPQPIQATSLGALYAQDARQ